MRLGAHAHGSRDGAEVQRKRPERCQHQRGEPRQRDQAGDRKVIARCADHRNARQVLRGHGDDKQGNGQTDGGGQAELRRREYRHGQLQLHGGPGHLPRQRHHCHRGGQCDDDSIAGRPPAGDQVHHQHGQHQGQGCLGGSKGLQAKARQHTRKKGRRDFHGNAVHHPFEPARHTRQGDERGADHEGPHRFAHAESASQARSGQHGRAGCGPCHHDRLAQDERGHEGAQAHPQPQRPHPGGDLRRGGAKRLRSLEHDGDRTREPHQHRDEPCGERRQAQVFEELHGRDSVTPAHRPDAGRACVPRNEWRCNGYAMAMQSPCILLYF